MKNYKIWFLLILLLTYTLVTGVAVAQDRVRVFQLNSGPLFEEFEAHMKETGFLQVGGEVLPTYVLGLAAFRLAEEKNHLRLVPVSNRTQESYIDLFQRWNGLDETITLTEFRRKGQQAGFWLPVARPTTAQTAVATAPSTAELAQSLQELQERLSELPRADGGQIEVLRKDVDDLATQFGVLSSDNAQVLGALDLLRENLAGDISQQSSRIDTVMQEVGPRLQGEIDSLHSRLETVEQTVSGHSDRIAQLEVTQQEGQSAVGSMWQSLAIAAIAIFVLLVLFLGWRWKSKDGVAIRALGERVATVENTKVVFDNQLQELKEAGARVETRVRDMEEGTYGVQFNTAPITRSRVVGMKEGERVLVMVIDDQDQKYLVEVTRGRDDVVVSGVQRRKGGGQEAMTVPLSTHLPTLIAKAAKDGRLSSPQGGGQVEKAVA